ncbi:Acyl-CoA synthetase (NDP forming)-like protein [Geotalea uraniireducens Rf4]|uniref:Acyl-CoA synthetase (NDP forming)-like protein n=1 Tax=Geotalea uraniireducens (strain Rf4) TaxID=351605 RepID=A5G5K0_GEOUR|nr:Acyl-CoA synthetase (NDP forming)-like protein [Geotalea uraniireducens Rf4]
MTTEKLRRFLAAHGNSQTFLEQEVKGLLRELGIAVPSGVFIPAGEPVPSPHSLLFPLVAKAALPGVASKNDIGGVRLGIRDAAELSVAVAELEKIPVAAGVLVEEMARPGVEVIVGGAVDPQFGPIVMFGLGGLFVELFRDVAFAMAPLDRRAARRLVEATKGAVVLRGYRGKPPVDMESLLSVVVAVSELIGSGFIEEIDLNPVELYPDGALVVDAKMKRRSQESW